MKKGDFLAICEELGGLCCLTDLLLRFEWFILELLKSNDIIRPDSDAAQDECLGVLGDSLKAMKALRKLDLQLCG